MTKFNVVDSRRIRATGPIVSVPGATTVTHEGAPAFAYDTKSELFTLAVANFVGEDTFYEKAQERDDRYTGLVREVAVADGAWMLEFVRWLRATANMRSASLVAAAEAVHARLAAGLHGLNRSIVDVAMQRADEPGEFVAYWRGKHGRTLPKPAKRGLGDALLRLVNEYAALKYDTDTRGYRLGDVIDLVRPAPTAEWQSALFEHLLARRHGRDELFRADALRLLPMAAARKAFYEIDPTTRRALLGSDGLREMLRVAGLTWEALSAWIDGPMDAAAWESVIPTMGLMALARNLRNFDQAGVSDEVAAQITALFSDPEKVVKSRMFPYRWLAAFEQAPSVRWAHGLDRALRASVSAISEFAGRTLVLVDTSASMTHQGYSARSKMTPAKAAAIFGTAIAHRNPGRVELVGFADGTFVHSPRKGGSLVDEVKRFVDRTSEVGYGTQIAASLRRHYRAHDRVFIISDMQTMVDPYGHGSNPTACVPANKPVYGVNLGGYATTVIPSGQGARRFEFAGLTDAMFKMVPLLEAGTAQGWPWE